MKMKKFIAVYLVLTLIAGVLGGCGKGEVTAAEVMPEVTTVAVQEQVIETTAQAVGLAMNAAYLAELTKGDADNTQVAVLEEDEITIVLKATSVEKDLKIKFVNQKTGKVVSGTLFEVKVTGEESAKTYKDEDKDGIIHIKEIAGGSYKIEATALGTCRGGESITAKVKEKLEYEVVDVADEIKKESEINTAGEDAGSGTPDASTTAATLTDTVEYVASTKTEIYESAQVQKKDAFGQPMYTLLKKDSFGSDMYAVIISEPAAFHVDADNNGSCDRCGTSLAPAHTHSYVDTVITPATCTTAGSTQKVCSCGDAQAPTEIPATGHSFSGGVCSVCGEADPSYSAPEETPTARAELRFNGISTAATAPDKIVYDTNSAPIYDTSSEPVYEESKTVTGYKYTGWQTIDGRTYYFDKNGNKVTGSQVIQGVQYTFDSNGARSSVIGIDVSKFQTSINWSQVKNAGIDFVYVRCGYRGYGSGVLVEDSMFRSHVSGAKAAGLKVGLYFFSQAITEAEAVEEASMAVSLARSVGGISLPIAIDSEYANNGKGRADGLSKSARTAITQAFCNTIASAGYTPMVYASSTWFKDHLNASALGSYRIWVAHYAERCGYSGRYDIWQYTSKGNVPGVKGSVDMDISYF